MPHASAEPPTAFGTDQPISATEYCRRITRQRYENFTVASLLIPRRLRPHFWHIYAYCRIADDLADEIEDTGESLDALRSWEKQLLDCYEGRVAHPVFVALRETIAEFEIPPEPFVDLLSAFRQDREKNRYETHADVLDYCRRSADPVGRLVLFLGGRAEEPLFALSDSVCTGLQLANFCQDVASDWDRGRVYLPLESCREFGYGEEMFVDRAFNEPFRRLMGMESQRAADYLNAGRPLIDQVPDWLGRQVRLYIDGGIVVLDAIREAGFDVWSQRPTVSNWNKAKLVWRAWLT